MQPIVELKRIKRPAASTKEHCFRRLKLVLSTIFNVPLYRTRFNICCFGEVLEAWMAVDCVCL